MKLIIFFTIAASLQATAGALAQRITISVKNESLKGVLKEIRKQSGYSFIYSDLDMKGAKAVTLDIVNKEIAQVLPVLFNNQSLTYSIDGKFINISSSPVKSTVNSSVIAKESLMQGAITGYIFDQANNPLAGASVQIRGTQYATKTDTKGHFFFSIRPDNSMLIISFLGYKPIEISTDQDLSHIQMSSLTNNLEEVNVVFSTGYQSIAKERSAGSFAKPSKEQLVNRSNSLNLIQNLDGLVPGLTVNNSPGSDNILIRGLSSINS
ncbi:carboxypeptidase-like regulatory domain-containing protein, partial [Sphingobacterium sp.]|uniref:carboxypeptidase-like regulatory domain-containing protein n=1 Tax=Sphingobacterium sp. TaxID=341027 RepID=UPI00289C7EEF